MSLTRPAWISTSMYKLKQSTQFKKDLKKYCNDSNKMKLLREVTTHLVESGKVPRKFKPHRLKGNYKGCFECHLESDFLLVWIDAESRVIKLVRLGSHSELFWAIHCHYHDWKRWLRELTLIKNPFNPRNPRLYPPLAHWAWGRVQALLAAV